MSCIGTMGRQESGGKQCDLSCFLSHKNYALVQSLNYEQEVSVSGYIGLTSYHIEKQRHLILEKEKLERQQQKFWTYTGDPCQSTNNQKIISNSKELKTQKWKVECRIQSRILSATSLKIIERRSTSSIITLISPQGMGNGIVTSQTHHKHLHYRGDTS